MFPNFFHEFASKNAITLNIIAMIKNATAKKKKFFSASPPAIINDIHELAKHFCEKLTMMPRTKQFLLCLLTKNSKPFQVVESYFDHLGLEIDRRKILLFVEGFHL